MLYPWSKEEVQVFVEKNLVLRVSSAEVLEKRVCQGHDLVHLLIILYKQTKHTLKMKQLRRMFKRTIDVGCFGCCKPSHKGSAAGPAPQCGLPCSSAAFAAAHDSSYWDNTAY